MALSTWRLLWRSEIGMGRAPSLLALSARPLCSPSLLVIPAQAGIQFFLFALCFKCRASTRPTVERVTFLCLCKEKSPKETHPGGALSGHPALRVRERAPGGAERTSVCAQRPLAHPARAPSGFSSTRSPRHRGPIWAASCRRSSRSYFLLLRQISREGNDRNDAVQGCTDSCTNGRRSRRRASQDSRDQPEGARRWIAAIAKQHRDCAV